MRRRSTARTVIMIIRDEEKINFLMKLFEIRRIELKRREREVEEGKHFFIITNGIEICKF